MGTIRPDPLKLVHFHCRACRNRFEAEPEQVAEAPELEHHPYRYLAECPRCGAQAEQAAWERALMKAHAHATGPKTPAGKAATAANLKGHPTPEETLRTRFNAMKHGLNSRVASYFPAKPGKYAACDGCEHMETLSCLEGPRACLRRTELYLRHHIAFETQDPTLLREQWADNQAGIQALINDMILAIAQDGGPRVKEVVWYHDDNGFQLAGWQDERGEFRQIFELKAHPLLKPLMEFISKNAMTLADMEMTPKVRDEQELMAGFLDQKGANSEDASAYQQRVLEQQDRLLQLVQASYDREGEVIDAEVVRD